MVGQGIAAILTLVMRPAPPVSEQPRLTIEHWSLLALIAGGSQKVVLVGYIRQLGVARITSPVAAIDVVARVVTTSSGRVYDLRGPSGHDERAELVIRFECALRDAVAIDVTHQVFGDAPPPSGTLQ